MKLSHLWWGSVVCALLAPPVARPAELFDLAPFARRCCVEDRHSSQVEFDYQEARRAGAAAEKADNGRYIYGLQWAEERDISEVRVRFRAGSQPQPAVLEYWFRNWPYPPPH